MSCGQDSIYRSPCSPELHTSASWEAGKAGSFLKTRLRSRSFILCSLVLKLRVRSNNNLQGDKNQMHASSVLYLCWRIKEAQKYRLTTLLPSQCNCPINIIQYKELHFRWVKLQKNCLISFFLQWKNYLVTGTTRFPFHNKHLLTKAVLEYVYQY